MLQLDSLESAIHRELGRIGSCSLAELNERLPYYSSFATNALPHPSFLRSVTLVATTVPCKSTGVDK